MKTSKALLIGVFSMTLLNATAAEQKIRTPFLDGWDQIPLAEMEKKAADFAGAYWIAGPGQRKQMALTFDDGPTEHTRELLKVLKKHNIHATFFWLGKQAEQFPNIVKEAAAAGHTIGNHSYDHPYSSKLSASVFNSSQIVPTQKIFQSILGFAPTLFRPPYGDLSDAEMALLQKNNMHAISWSVDTRDWLVAWNKGQPAEIEKVVLNYAHPEAIVLMHDGGGPRQSTIAAVDAFIPKLKEQGYEFITVDKLLGVAGKQ
ncbi:polysaccharide deacetylase family protein [Iodobacter sp. CM08]|uniref:polysaccharide deacetylase family protein n=1 Tax=Iodobacter sp. CM08 TaxID=3085902 RepID=UPI0029829CEF|nr:polysaccharide deacetylase family protein [Iodobacter sp. CM08]MDW5418055.1 polysaccharide deacetylase family protein [Iodobacter sp. CM08]